MSADELQRLWEQIYERVREMEEAEREVRRLGPDDGRLLQYLKLNFGVRQLLGEVQAEVARIQGAILAFELEQYLGGEAEQ